MKMLTVSLSAVVVALSLSSCNLKEKYAKNESATVAYLAQNKTQSAKTNVEGVWYAPQWGIVLLNQEAGGKVNGYFEGGYSVDGIVSGRKVYLALADGSWTDYTVQLTQKSSDELVGFYSSSVPFSDKDKEELVLKRIEQK